MTFVSLERAWRVLIDTVWLGVIRAALTAIQIAAEALRLDGNGRRAIVTQLSAALLPPPPSAETEAG